MILTNRTVMIRQLIGCVRSGLTVYDQVGGKIKADLVDGNAVVLFAYGLSGSGKTFTVFGPDAVDIPEAW